MFYFWSILAAIHKTLLIVLVFFCLLYSTLSALRALFECSQGLWIAMLVLGNVKIRALLSVKSFLFQKPSFRLPQDQPREKVTRVRTKGRRTMDGHLQLAVKHARTMGLNTPGNFKGANLFSSECSPENGHILGGSKKMQLKIFATCTTSASGIESYGGGKNLEKAGFIKNLSCLSRVPAEKLMRQASGLKKT